MTDKELIRALRCCSSYISTCGDCPIPEDENCFDMLKSAAADRLEQLTGNGECGRKLPEVEETDG